MISTNTDSRLMRHTNYRNILLLTMAAALVSEAGASELPVPGEGACRKVTADLDGAYHQYFAVPAWNADGSRLLVIRKRDGKKKAWIIDDRGDDGFGEPEELPLDVFYFYLQWDAKDPRRRNPNRDARRRVSTSSHPRGRSSGRTEARQPRRDQHRQLA